MATVKTKKKGKQSLTKQLEKSYAMMNQPRLSEVADSFDKEAMLKKHFQRTIDDVFVVRDRKKITTKTAVMDGMEGINVPCCGMRPNENADSSMMYNQLNLNNVNEKVLRHFQDNFAWIGWLTCATLAQHPFISRACSIPGEDAVSVGYNITFNGDVNDKDELAKTLIKKAKRMGLNNVLRHFDCNKRVFGVGICIPCFDGIDDTAKDYIMTMMENPYNVDAVKNKNITFTGFKVVDPYWLTPVFDDRSGFDPTSKDFYLPTWWQVGGTSRRIHKSWCFQYVNTIVADILKPTYYYGGMPLPQMLMERLYSADKVADEAQLLAMSKRLLVVDANVQKLVSNPKEALKVMDALKYARDNWGVFFKNPNTNVQQVDTYITEFNQLIMTQYQLVASIAQIPAPKLLKVMPTGFSDVSELVWKDYAQQIASIQEDEFEPIVERFFEIMFAKSGTNIDFNISFNPVDVPTLMEKAQISELEAKASKNLIEQGVLAPEEVRTVIRNKKGGVFASISKEQDKAAVRKDIIKADTVNQKAKTDNAGKIAVAKITAKKQSQAKKSEK